MWDSAAIEFFFFFFHSIYFQVCCNIALYILVDKGAAIVRWRYLKTCFMTVMCCKSVPMLYDDTIDMGKARSGGEPMMTGKLSDLNVYWYYTMSTRSSSTNEECAGVRWCVTTFGVELLQE